MNERIFRPPAISSIPECSISIGIRKNRTSFLSAKLLFPLSLQKLYLTHVEVKLLIQLQEYATTPPPLSVLDISGTKMTGVKTTVKKIWKKIRKKLFSETKNSEEKL